MKILIDNGHGVTCGNSSPDKSLKEYAYARIIAQKLVEKLKASGYDAERIVVEDTDITLGERCRRVNRVCDRLGANNVIFISIHVDAAGSGPVWRTAGGWTAFTTRGQTKADKLAECLYDSAEVHLNKYAHIMYEGQKRGDYDLKQKPFRVDKTDGDRDKEAGFYVLVHTRCAAVLTENLFQDNKSDVKYLLSDEGKNAIVDLHFEGIVRYIRSVKG